MKLYSIIIFTLAMINCPVLFAAEQNRLILSTSKYNNPPNSMLEMYNDQFQEKFKPEYFEKVRKKDARDVGNVILDLAVLSKIQKESFAFTYLEQWCEKAISVESWGNNHDLEVSHLIFGLSLAYSWHGENFTPSLRNSIKIFLLNRTEYLYNFSKNKLPISWVSSYWMNHCWINYTAMLASGLALQEESADGDIWARHAEEKLRTTLKLFPGDGSNHEGLNYSIYGNIWLIRGMALLEKNDPLIFQKTNYLKNYHLYFKAMNPGNDLINFFDMGDSPKNLWYNPCEVFSKLYSEYGNPEDLRLYLFYRDQYKIIRPGTMSMIYGSHGPDDTPISFEDSYFSEDLGIYIGKHSDDVRINSAIAFKSGIPGGRYSHNVANSNRNYRLNLSHNHPDQNHFIYWVNNTSLISDTGYTLLKSTADHNSLLVNGVGQLGSGTKWFDEAAIRGVEFPANAGLLKKNIYETNNLTVLWADAAAFYPKKLGLKSYKRTLIWIKSIGLIILDEIQTVKPTTIQLLFHSQFKARIQSDSNYDFMDNSKAIGHLTVLLGDQYKIFSKEDDSIQDKQLSARGDVVVIERKVNDAGIVSGVFIGQESNKNMKYILESNGSTIKIGIQDELYEVFMKPIRILHNGREIWKSND